MATFQAQVQGLTSLTISSSGTSPTEAELTQFLTDGAKEIINQLPNTLKEKSMSITNLYIGNTDTTMDLDGKGQIIYVTREKVYHIAYPTVAYGDSAIANFPDEAEYLVPLYGSIKALQNAMGAMQTNTAIDTTALGAVVTELNRVDNIIVEASDKIDAY